MENKEDLWVAIDAALQAGQTIREIYEKPITEYEIEKKGDASPLTLADRKAHKVISNCLCKTNYPILSEEGSLDNFNTRSLWKSLWIVDPLDGTKEFIKGNGEFTVNIALVYNQNPIVGVIYVPVTSTLYFSSHTLGAYKISSIQQLKSYTNLEDLIGKAKRLPLKKERDNLVVLASRSHISPSVSTFINELKSKYCRVDTTSIGSSLKFCLVAEGTADCYPRFTPTMEWDTAAGHAIASAAGISVYQMDSKTPLLYNKPNLLNPYFIVKNNKMVL